MLLVFVHHSTFQDQVFAWLPSLLWVSIHIGMSLRCSLHSFVRSFVHTVLLAQSSLVQGLDSFFFFATGSGSVDLVRVPSCLPRSFHCYSSATSSMELGSLTRSPPPTSSKQSLHKNSWMDRSSALVGASNACVYGVDDPPFFSLVSLLWCPKWNQQLLSSLFLFLHPPLLGSHTKAVESNATFNFGKAGQIDR